MPGSDSRGRLVLAVVGALAQTPRGGADMIWRESRFVVAGLARGGVMKFLISLGIQA